MRVNYRMLPFNAKELWLVHRRRSRFFHYHLAALHTFCT